MQCLILAGGFATRLWPLTEKRAKPLLPLAGKPLLTHLAEKIPAQMPVTVSTNAVFEKDMKKWAKTIQGRNIAIYVEDAGKEDEKLGALGATSRWIREKKIDDDLLLLAGDNYVGFDIETFVAKFAGKPLIAAHDVQDREQAKRFGTVIVEQSGSDMKKVAAFEEKPAQPKSTLVSTGCYVLPKDTLEVLAIYAKEHPDNIGGIFEEFLRQNIPVYCVAYEDIWRDIGSFHTYLQTHDDVLQGKQLTDESATIDDLSKLTGSISIGPKTVIEKSELVNCIVFGNTMIENCVLQDCVIDTGCTLKNIDLSSKMIRAGTKLIRKL